MAGIRAIVTVHEDKAAGDTPIFFAGNGEELQSLSRRLEKILDATAHELIEGTIILVDHRSQD
ncbi:capping complex subunit for YIEGIA [Paenibacillus turpanensis]|uniref:capping complex subunit for YIEGIA n=1 Tax=Paenibacillus turpanensis TaxID=2689078 RepID=UPI0014094760|nr:hypothetical protein [Paenibacillus turpanensis]